MSDDLISRSALLAEFEDFKDMDCPSGHTVTADYMIELAEYAPAVDAVEVVRCDECIFAKNFRSAYVDCKCLRASVPRDGFCFNGARKMDAEVSNDA